MKKSQVAVTIYFRIFEILLLLMVVSMVFVEIKNIDDSGIYQKKFLSRDIALLLDSLTNARGNVFYAYDTPEATLARFEYDFSNGRVTVDGESWAYAKNNNYEYVFTKIKKPKWLLLQKQGKQVSIQKAEPGSKTPEFNILLLDCPQSTTKISEVVLDPGKGYNAKLKQGEKGAEWTGKEGPKTESEYTMLVARSLRSQLDQQKKVSLNKIFSTRSLDVDEHKTLEERIKTITEHPKAIIISLHVGKQGKEQNVVKAFVNKDSKNSAGLACGILNKIARKYWPKITGTVIVPVSTQQLSSDDPRKVLKQEGVLLELGSADPDNPLLQNPRETATIIAGGIE